MAVTNLSSGVTPYVLTGSRYVPGSNKPTSVYTHLGPGFSEHVSKRLKSIFDANAKHLPEKDRSVYLRLCSSTTSPDSSDGLLMEAWFEYLTTVISQTISFENLTVLVSSGKHPATSPFLNLAYYSGMEFDIPIRYNAFNTYGSLAPFFDPNVDTEYILFIDGYNCLFNKHIEEEELIAEFKYYNADMVMASSSHKVPDEYAYYDEKYGRDIKNWFLGLSQADASSKMYPFCNSNSFMCTRSFFYHIFFKQLQKINASEVIARLGSKKPLINHDLGTHMFQLTYPNSQLDRECRIFQPMDYGDNDNEIFNITPEPETKFMYRESSKNTKTISTTQSIDNPPYNMVLTNGE